MMQYDVMGLPALYNLYRIYQQYQKSMTTPSDIIGSQQRGQQGTPSDAIPSRIKMRKRAVRIVDKRKTHKCSYYYVKWNDESYSWVNGSKLRQEYKLLMSFELKRSERDDQLKKKLIQNRGKEKKKHGEMIVNIEIGIRKRKKNVVTLDEEEEEPEIILVNDQSDERIQEQRVEEQQVRLQFFQQNQQQQHQVDNNGTLDSEIEALKHQQRQMQEQRIQIFSQEGFENICREESWGSDNEQQSNCRSLAAEQQKLEKFISQQRALLCNEIREITDVKFQNGQFYVKVEWGQNSKQWVLRDLVQATNLQKLQEFERQPTSGCF